MPTEYRNNDANSTDATTGQQLRARVEARKAAIVAALANPATHAQPRRELEVALGEVVGLLTGDLDKIPKVVAAELNTWLEANKHVDEHQPG